MTMPMKSLLKAGLRVPTTAVLLLAQACGASAAVEAKSGGAPPGMPASEGGPTAAGDMDEASAAPAGMRLARAEAGLEPAPSAPPPGDQAAQPAAPAQHAAAGAPADDGKVLAEARKMVDIEARLSIEVKEVQQAARELKTLVNKSGGQLINESLTTNDGGSRAELSLRVPAQAASDFFAAVERIGAVRNRQVTAKDIGKQYYDATIRLQNLEVVRKRYEEILNQAKNLEEILRIEAELSRMRQQIEQLKGELRWMRDRAVL
jgi:HAMP domain-containing protein